jgi:hypothetical protein
MIKRERRWRGKGDEKTEIIIKASTSDDSGPENWTRWDYYQQQCGI